jgi:putative copper resistance protein D
MELEASGAQSGQIASDDHSMHAGHTGHVMSSPNQSPEKLLADKKESEFNHHLAGFFVALGGAFMLLQGLFGKSEGRTRYVWPATFLLSGIFVFVFSDTELWPFGHYQWLERLQNSREVLQHKTFSVLLLALGIIEWRRVKQVSGAVWSGLVFPVLAIAGSILLLFHQHEGGMQGPNHMEVMARIQAEHLNYALLGIGLGLMKGMAELKTNRQRVFQSMWPLLMISLGILLMFYRE